MGPLAALKHRDFRLFWLGQAVSLIGTWTQTVAQSWLVLDMTKSPFLLGCQTMAQYGPVFGLSLFAGCLADRFPKRRLLIVVQSTMCVLAFALGILTLVGQVSYLHIIIFSLLLGIATAFDTPARHSLVTEMVGKEDVVGAVSLNTSILNLARIVGPAVAGLVIGAFGPGVAFLLNGASYIPVIVALTLMGDHGPKTQHPPYPMMSRMISEIREGFAYVDKKPAMSLAVVSATTTSVFLFNYHVLIPVLAREVLGGSATATGFLMSSMGLGALCGAFFGSYVNRNGPSLRVIALGILGLSLASVVTAVLTYPSALSTIAMGAYGASGIIVMNTVNSLLQINSPDYLRGRVMGIYSLITRGSPFLGGLFAGAICDALGARWGFAISGMIGFVYSVALAGWAGLRAHAVRRAA
ncbi:MAG: MFS transporter [Firmicutes bacterium]|nr:MFS transporter [Bacillota bacterium]